MKVKVAIPDDGNDGKFVTVEVPLLSDDVRAMIDNMIDNNLVAPRKALRRRRNDLICSRA